MNSFHYIISRWGADFHRRTQKYSLLSSGRQLSRLPSRFPWRFESICSYFDWNFGCYSESAKLFWTHCQNLDFLHSIKMSLSISAILLLNLSGISLEIDITLLTSRIFLSMFGYWAKKRWTSHLEKHFQSFWTRK